MSAARGKSHRTQAQSRRRSERTAGHEQTPSHERPALRADGGPRGRGFARVGLSLALAVVLLPATTGIVTLLNRPLGPAGQWLLSALTVGGTVLALMVSAAEVMRRLAPGASRRWRAGAVTAIAGTFALILSLFIALEDPFAKLPKMSGTQDVASLGFVRPDGSSTDLDELSQVLVDQLGPALPGRDVVSYAAITNPPLELLGRPDSGELEDWTAKFMEASGADIIVAGIVDDQSDRQVRLRPALYVRPSLVPEAPELVGWMAGQWTIGVGDTGSRRGQQSLLSAYLEDGVDLAKFVDALDAWRVGRTGEAEGLLDVQAGWRTGNLFSADFIHLFRGHALQLTALRGPSAGREALLIEAADEYRSIDLRSVIGLRARLSLANNDYLRSVGSLCRSGTVDASRLINAATILEQLSKDHRLMPVSRLTASVNFAQARVCAMRAGISSDRESIAAALLRVRSFKPDEGPSLAVVLDLKALGRSIEGILAESSGDTPKAITLMREAIELTDDTVDRGRWWGFISLWESRLCDIAEAYDAHNEAVSQYHAAAEAGRISQDFLGEYRIASASELAATAKTCPP